MKDLLIENEELLREVRMLRRKNKQLVEKNMELSRANKEYIETIGEMDHYILKNGKIS